MQGSKTNNNKLPVKNNSSQDSLICFLKTITANLTPQKALQAELVQTSPTSRKKTPSQSGRSMLTPSGWGDYLLGLVLRLHHPLHVSVAQDEGPVEDGQRGVHGHDGDDQRVYHDGRN